MKRSQFYHAFLKAQRLTSMDGGELLICAILIALLRLRFWYLWSKNSLLHDCPSRKIIIQYRRKTIRVALKLKHSHHKRLIIFCLYCKYNTQSSPTTGSYYLAWFCIATLPRSYSDRTSPWIIRGAMGNATATLSTRTPSQITCTSLQELKWHDFHATRSAKNAWRI